MVMLFTKNMRSFIMAIGEIMGILNRPIEMIAFHTAAGEVTPMRFKIMDGDDVSVVKVDRIINRTKEKSLGIWYGLPVHLS